MRLPDFSEHVGLNRLRGQMEAELIPWNSGANWTPISIDEILITTGLDISPEEIEYAPDGTLEYQGQRVIVYIRDQYHRDEYALHSYELINPEHLCRFHVADCQTLRQMRRQGRYDRYVVSTRRDGRFTVNFLDGNRLIEQEVDCRLYVCRHCLDRLNYQNYRNRRTQRDEIRDSFDLNEFFEMYNSRIAIEPTETDITAPVNQYPPNWPQIRARYKEKVGWRCEGCDINLEEETRFLEVHHRNGLKNDNSETNLRALCIGCHAEQFQHQHIRSNPRYLAFLQWRNQQQSNREDVSSQLILQ